MQFQDDTVTSDESSMFVEAMIFHWSLFLVGKDGFVHATKDSGDQLKKRTEHEEHTSKRCKRDHPFKVVEKLRSCYSSSESSEKQCFFKFTSHQVSCSATLRGVNNDPVVRSIILYYTGALNGCGFCIPSAQKVLLEFKPESFHIYQVCDVSSFHCF